MRRKSDIAGGLRWAYDAHRPSTRAARFTAWVIATSGPSAIDGANSVPEAASAHGVPLATLYLHLKYLAVHHGLVAARGDTVPDRLATPSASSRRESDSTEQDDNLEEVSEEE